MRYPAPLKVRLEETAQALGLSFDASEGHIKGSYNGFDITLELTQNKQKLNLTTLLPQPLPFRLDITLDVPSIWGEKKHPGDLKLGDAAFDSRFLILSDQPEDARRLLNAEVRSALRKLSEVQSPTISSRAISTQVSLVMLDQVTPAHLRDLLDAQREAVMALQNARWPELEGTTPPAKPLAHLEQNSLSPLGGALRISSFLSLLVMPLLMCSPLNPLLYILPEAHSGQTLVFLSLVLLPVVPTALLLGSYKAVRHNKQRTIDLDPAKWEELAAHLHATQRGANAATMQPLTTIYEGTFFTLTALKPPEMRAQLHIRAVIASPLPPGVRLLSGLLRPPQQQHTSRLLRDASPCFELESDAPYSLPDKLREHLNTAHARGSFPGSLEITHEVVDLIVPALPDRAALDALLQSLHSLILALQEDAEAPQPQVEEATSVAEPVGVA